MSIEDVRIVRLRPEQELAAFDCGNEDLNDFLLKDAIDYQKSLIAVTYLVKHNEEVAAYFSNCQLKIAINLIGGR